MTAASYDIDTEDFRELADFADSVGGTLAVTHEGRLLIYGVDADDLVKSQPFERFYLSRIDKDMVGFEF